MNDDTTSPEADDDAPIVPRALTAADATKLDDEIGRAGTQAIGGLAGDDEEPADA